MGYFFISGDVQGVSSIDLRAWSYLGESYLKIARRLFKTYLTFFWRKLYEIEGKSSTEIIFCKNKVVKCSFGGKNLLVKHLQIYSTVRYQFHVRPSLPRLLISLPIQWPLILWKRLGMEAGTSSLVTHGDDLQLASAVILTGVCSKVGLDLLWGEVKLPWMASDVFGIRLATWAEWVFSLAPCDRGFEAIVDDFACKEDFFGGPLSDEDLFVDFTLDEEAFLVCPNLDEELLDNPTLELLDNTSL